MSGMGLSVQQSLLLCSPCCLKPSLNKSVLALPPPSISHLHLARSLSHTLALSLPGINAIVAIACYSGYNQASLITVQSYLAIISLFTRARALISSGSSVTHLSHFCVVINSLSHL